MSRRWSSKKEQRELKISMVKRHHFELLSKPSSDNNIELELDSSDDDSDFTSNDSDESDNDMDVYEDDE